ncbi:MAG: NADH-quinone oxidoreductase subunit B family protein [Anaerolineae bacterium]
MTTSFAVLQLSGCAGCEVSLLNAEDWIGRRSLSYMPLVLSTEDMPEVATLLVSGAVRTDEDLYRLRRAAGRAREVIAVGTCAISGGVANLGDRDAVRELFFAERARQHVPNILPKLHPVDAVVPVDRYLPGCPPTPELFMAALFDPEGFQGAKNVCIECGRTKTRTRPSSLLGFQGLIPDPGICLINQGYLCVGTSTRGGCRAPCTRAGHPCVGCRGPSDSFISRSSHEWFEAIKKVFERMTDVPAAEIDAAVRSPQLSLFVFQFADYAAIPRDVKKVL